MELTELLQEEKKIWKGIDISRYQGQIDFKKVKEAGIEFIIIRIGSTTSGTMLNKDPMFEEYFAKATEVEIPVGVYYYSQATTSIMAETEAEHVLKLLDRRELDLPIFLDIEDARHKTIGKKKLANIYKAFADAIEMGSPYTAKCYTGLDFLRNYIDDDLLYERSGSFWMAQYNREITYSKPQYVGIWQYSSKGNIDGIKGDVDLNIAYLDVTKMLRADKPKEKKKEWIKDNRGWWYRHADGSYTRGDWEQIDGEWYYFNSEGYMKTGWISWKEQWYFCREDGRMVRGEVMQIRDATYGEEKYSFAEDGHLEKSNFRGALV